MKNGIKLARAVAKQIEEGQWIPYWNPSTISYVTMQKIRTDNELWIANGWFFCEMYKPVQYNPFGFIGRIIVHRAAWKYIGRMKIKPTEIKREQIKQMNAKLLDTL